jgi:hypothetical protein
VDESVLRLTTCEGLGGVIWIV